MADGHDERNEDQDRAAAAGAPDKPRSGNEGVRILGAEEAQAALDAGAVSRRLDDDAVRYGDVPARPDPTIRPAVSFPRPPVDEGGESWSASDDGEAPAPAAADADSSPEPTAVEPITGDLGADPGSPFDTESLGTESFETESLFDEGPAPDEEPVPADHPAAADVGRVPGPDASGPVALPHWTEPPTGEVPQILPEAEAVDLTGEEDLETFRAAGGPRFRTGADWVEEDFAGLESLADDAAPLGALADAPSASGDDEFDREVQARRRIRPRMVSSRPERAGAGARGSAVPSELDHDPFAEPDGGPQPDMATRVITGVGIAVLALICLKLGRGATATLATVIVGLAAFELYQAFQSRGFRPASILGVLASIAMVPIAYNRGDFAFTLVPALLLVFTMLWYLLEVVRARPVVNIGVTLLAFMYVGFFGGFAGLLLGYQNGVGLILGVAMCAVASDVFGYVVGSQFGKRRIAPTISPNKTVEGMIGGMVASLVVAVAIVNAITPWTKIGDAVALGLVVAVAAPVGDLCESLLKRDLGVKDLGSILPGHGGVLDRFDAILFSLPAVYFLALALKSF